MKNTRLQRWFFNQTQVNRFWLLGVFIIIIMGAAFAIIVYQQFRGYQLIIEDTRAFDHNLKQTIFSTSIAYTKLDLLLDGDGGQNIQDVYQDLAQAQASCNELAKANISNTMLNMLSNLIKPSGAGQPSSICAYLDRFQALAEQYWGQYQQGGAAAAPAGANDLELIYIDFLKTAQPFLDASTSDYRSATYLMRRINVITSVGLGATFLLIATIAGFDRRKLQRKNAQLNAEIEKRLEIEAELAGERDLINTLIDNLPDAIFAKDQERRFLIVNAAGAKVMGVERPELLVGKNEMDFLPHEIAEKTLADEMTVLQSGHPIIDRVETIGQDGTGKAAWRLTTKIPLSDRSGHIVGLVGISRDITEQKLAEQAMKEANLKQEQNIDALAKYTRETLMINEAIELMLACTTMEEAYAVIAEKMAELFPEESGLLYTYASSHNHMEQMSAWGKQLPDPQIFPADDCWGLRRGRMHISRAGQNAHTNKSTLVCSHIHSDFSVDSVCLPLEAHGETMGLLHMRHIFSPGDGQNSQVNWFTDEKRQLIYSVKDVLSLALSNMKLQSTLRQQSIRDPLTGLYNRRYLEETLERELQRAGRSQEPVSLLMLDVDHFKDYNDTLGHPAADAVLAELGQLLKNSFRGGDVACRYGGEEFIILLPQTDLGTGVQRGNQLLESVRSMNVSYQGKILARITVSIGAAVYPDHGHTVEELIHRADEALYQAKQTGRDRLVEAR